MSQRWRGARRVALWPGFDPPPPAHCSFVTLSDVRNETILGFVFNSNAAPAPTPVVKGATNGAAASASTALRGALAAAAAAAALLLM